jgi:hypothetical protein
MKNIQKQGLIYRSGSGISLFCGMKRLILFASFLFFLNVIVFSQEPVVVTTVKKPAETEKKDSLTVSEETPVIPVQDTASVPEATNTELLNELVLQTNSVITFDKLSVGLGIGQDYGGFGGNILYYPQRNFGLFCGLGYNLAGVGYNLGIKSRIAIGSSSSHMLLSVLAMYGYNAVIRVADMGELNKVFYGATVGVGLDYKPFEYSDDYISVSLFVPFRSSEVQDYMDYLEQVYGVVFEQGLFPVTFSFGYRIVFQ